jgi:tRNA-dihydrouridine synthase A
MLGRAACDSPWMLAEVDSRYFGAQDPVGSRIEAAESIREFLDRSVSERVPARAVLRHLLGLFNGLPGARRWRRTLSDSTLLATHGQAILDRALEAIMETAWVADPPLRSGRAGDGLAPVGQVAAIG